VSTIKSTTYDPMAFDDPDPKFVPVTVKGEKYRLYEASADAAIRFRNSAAKSARLKDGKVVGVDGVADSELVLVANCLFHTNDNGDLGAPASEHKIRGWRVAVLKGMFERVKEMSDGLVDPSTPESLREQIAELQRQLAEAEAGGSPGKAAPSAGTGS
jgi:hypothetical protein